MLYVVISALLFTLSFSNPVFIQGIQGLTTFALIPSFIALSQSKFIKKSYLYGVLFALLTVLGTFYWFKNYGEFALIIILGVFMIYAIEYSTLFTFMWLAIKRTPPLYRPLVLACMWAGFEYIKSSGFLGFPWALFPNSLHNVPLLTQSAKIFGIWGISFMLGYINAVLFEIYLYKFHKPLLYMHPKYIQARNTHKLNIYKHSIFLSGIIAVLLLYGSIELMLFKKKSPDSYLKVLLIQHNINSWDYVPARTSLTSLVHLTKEALDDIETQGDPKPDIIVWSESVLSVPYNFEAIGYAEEFYSSYPEDEPFLDFIERINIPILTGSAWVDQDEWNTYYNAALIIKPDGTFDEIYAKNHLVPFAELLPFLEFEPFRRLMAKMGLPGSWSPYGSFNTLNIDIHNDDPNYYSGELRIGVPICFEDAFPYVIRNFVNNDTNLLINISNMSWAKTTVAAFQQHNASKFRSVETGLTYIRVGISGVTSIIDPRGVTLDEVPTFTPTYLYNKKVPLYFPTKTYTNIILGDYVGILTRLIGIIYAIILVISYRKEQKNRVTWY